MTISLKHILSLPPQIRAQTLHQALRWQYPAPSKVTLHRFFATSIRQRANTPPKPSLRRSKAVVSSARPHPPPIAPLPPPKQPIRALTYANNLLNANPKVPGLLLYKSPNHTSFTVTSYICGAVIMLGAYNMTKFMLYGLNPDQTKRPNMWFRLLVGSPAIIMAAAGTTFLIAPGRMIKSISLVRREIAVGVYRPMLNFEARVLPFWKSEIYEWGIGEVLMDKRVAGASLNYRNIPISQASEFSAPKSPYKPQQSLSQQLLTPFRLFNAAIMNFWPSLQRDTARMWVRNGMTYMRLGNSGNFKLDIHGCEILDHGHPLEVLVTSDANLRGGLLQWVQSVVSSSDRR